MPKLNFEIPVSDSPDEAFKKVKAYMSSSNAIKEYDSKLSCTFDESKKMCLVKGSQFKGDITTKDHKKGSIIAFSIDIPITLALFKGKIQELVEKNIKKLFKS